MGLVLLAPCLAILAYRIIFYKLNYPKAAAWSSRLRAGAPVASVKIETVGLQTQHIYDISVAHGM